LKIVYPVEKLSLIILFLLIGIGIYSFVSLNAIPYSGETEEWPILGDKFLDKTRSFGFEEEFLGRVTIPKSVEIHDDSEV
jgi:hypothetical protein